MWEVEPRRGACRLPLNRFVLRSSGGQETSSREEREKGKNADFGGRKPRL